MSVEDRRVQTTDPLPPTTVSQDASSPSAGTRTGPGRLLAMLGVVALAASAAVGGDLFGLRSRLFGGAAPKPKPAAVARSVQGAPLGNGGLPATAPAKSTVLRSQPWWQGVTTLQGPRSMAGVPLAVDPGALQWRAKWSCDSGHFVVTTAGGRRPVVDAPCPGTGTGYSSHVGAQVLNVTADGPWRLEIEQQVDVPLVEPPLPAMTAPGAARLATGTLYRIDQSGSGRVTLYRLAGGGYAVRLDDFFITPNVDLEIRFSPLDAPHTTKEYVASSPSGAAAPLNITTGSLNLTLSPSVDPTRYRSLVVWCPLINSAYAAATLEPAR